MKAEKTKKVKAVKKTPTQFSVDLDIKGLIMFVILAFMTAAVIFYLGVIFGKASRNPQQFAAVDKNQPDLKVVTEEKISQKDLEIYTIRSDESNVSNLKANTKNVLAEADRLINESKTKAETTVSKPVEATAKIEKKETATQPKAQWPDKTQKADSKQELYTVQVFATKDKEKAERYVRTLRKQEFDAYIVEANIEGQKIYRVRVGRKSRQEITKLNESLKSVIGGLGMKSRIIQIN